MNVPTTIICAPCREKGVTHRLMYNETSYPKIFCEKGHEFDSAEDAMAYEAMSKAAVERAAEPPPAPTKPVLRPPVAALEPPPAKMAETPIESEPTPAENTYRPLREHVAAIAATTYDGGKEISPVLIMAEEQAAMEAPKTLTIEHKSNGKFVPPKARKLAGGVLMLTVQIPDAYSSYLLAEAENQNQSVEQFFQEAVERGCEFRWFF